MRVKSYDPNLVYTKQDKLPRHKWKASNPNTVAGCDFKIERDYSKCGVCGGTGKTYDLVRAGRSRMVTCKCKG